MQDLFIDIETYSSVDITTSGAYKYIESPDFEILIVGYAIDDGPVKIVDLASGEDLPEEFLQGLLNPDIRKHAHNAAFERLSFKRIGYDVPAEEWYCTAVKAAYCGLPLSLDAVSKQLDLENKKLDTGKALIKYFSCPCKPTKTNGMRTRNYPWHNPEKWEMYKEYNKYDVLSEREIYYKLLKYDIPKSERNLYILDQAINDKGIKVDKELAESAIAVSEEFTTILTAEAMKLTSLTNPNSPAQIKKWIESKTGEVITSLAKDAMQELQDKFKDNTEVARVLAIRKSLSKTSVKKYNAMLNCAMTDDRVRGTFQFYGANRTGRWAGRLLQLQNLAKNHISNIAEVRELIRKRDIEAVQWLYEDVSDILSQLVRTGLIAEEGKVFSVADFSAIEARVISWLANEKWRMDVFYGDGKIYEATGSKMFGVPVSAITKGSALRDKAKISELALGYGGSLGALSRMGGEKMGLSKPEMMSLVRKWRLSNPAIVEMWGEFDEAAYDAIRYHRQIEVTDRNIIFDCDGDYMTIQLPSGRKLFYKEPRLSRGPKGIVILYKGVVQETKQWGEIDTYGGKLTENIVQAIARDMLGNSMLNLAARGFMPVAHIHDECLVEVPVDQAKEYYNEMVSIMSIPPTWASDFPLKADGYTTPFYLKD
ncbi:MAG: hypothetical protein K2G70_05875 [Turicibacter sp.]|nr:hypothetical protein [Turicibacter sp.]